MIITTALIKGAVPNVSEENLNIFVQSFNKWAPVFSINTQLRAAHFLAQVMHESSCLKRTEENLAYSSSGLLKTFPKYFKTPELSAEYAYKPTKIANRVYANRMGNGYEDSGDGWRYRGRGLIMITGRNNYEAYENSGYCNGSVTEHPEWLTSYPGAIKSAMWFWSLNGCNELADMDNIAAITKRINGGINGYNERIRYLCKFKKALRL